MATLSTIEIAVGTAGAIFEINGHYKNSALNSSQKAFRMGTEILYVGAQSTRLGIQVFDGNASKATLIATGVGEGTGVLREINRLACQDNISKDEELDFMGCIALAISRFISAFCKECPGIMGVYRNPIHTTAMVSQLLATAFINRRVIKETGLKLWSATVNVLGSDESPPSMIEVRLRYGGNDYLALGEEFAGWLREVRQARTIVDLPVIPHLFCHDPILTQYRCAISGKPTRFPVTVSHSNGTSVRYERAEILRIFDEHRTPPNWPSDAPCNKANLRVDEAAQSIINSRLSCLIEGVQNEKVTTDSSIIDLARTLGVHRADSDAQIGDRILANLRLHGLVALLSVKTWHHVFSGTMLPQMARVIEMVPAVVIKPGKYTSNLTAAARAILGAQNEADYDELATVSKNAHIVRIYLSKDLQTCDIEVPSIDRPNEQFIMNRAADLRLDDEQGSSDSKIGDQILAQPLLGGLISGVNVTALNRKFRGTEQPIKTRLLEVDLLSKAPRGQPVDRTQLEAAVRAVLGSGRREDLAALSAIAQVTPVLKLYVAMDRTRYEITNM